MPNNIVCLVNRAIKLYNDNQDDNADFPLYPTRDSRLPLLPRPNQIHIQALGNSARPLFAFWPSSAPSSPRFRPISEDSSSSPGWISDIAPFNRTCNINARWVSVKRISVRVFSKELSMEPSSESGDAGISCWMGSASVAFEGETVPVGVELARAISDGSDVLNNLSVVTCDGTAI